MTMAVGVSHLSGEWKLISVSGDFAVSRLKEQICLSLSKGVLYEKVQTLSLNLDFIKN